ncbi:trimeric intracellular cation channel family protein [Winogradskyella psychrotolerans]|uniref:trimeric intracellular cation channel family protein n=1 Tax=Winogradskyella psychrotolerans TaxID=1344585 RepID=UPI001C0705CE|nr:trimeric intracellular cation channel family protein [Winogradskyella psychrotolerans]MBU2928215.1 trimeric intracellular cation channel family protein [Winogradskyella psychrotolerans]
MFFQFIDILGTIAFAISGALVAMNKRMDPFGVLIIAFVTAVGGGTLRDVMIGIEPVSWMKNMTFVYVIISSAAFAVMFRKRINYLRKSLFLFDTIGIALYTVVGIETGLIAGLHPLVCISLGTMTACFGGVLRDILCNEIPVIFRKEIYATACILGGITYFLLLRFFEDRNILFVIVGVVVITVRLVAVRYKISLPTLYKKED